MMMRREFRTVFIQIALCSVLRMGVLFVADVANYLDFCPAPLELVQAALAQSAERLPSEITTPIEDYLI
jgi:hypothetical protein